MSLWSRLGFNKKESEAQILIAQQNQGMAVTTPRQYDKLAKEGYNKNAVAYACVNKIAVAMKSMKFLLFQRPTSQDGRIIEIMNHPILDLLRRPNPLMAGPKYWETIAAFRQLSGNSYSHTSPENDPPKELWPLRPDRMRIVPNMKTGLPGVFEYKVGGRVQRYEVDGITGESRVLHTKSFNPLNDWYGMSPIEAAAFSIDQHNESGRWNVGLMQNSARPSGILIIKSKLKDEVRAQLKADLDMNHTGAMNAGRPLVINGADADWKGLSFTPKDMDWIKGKNTSARDIALAFGVPPQLLGIPGDNTFSNYKEAREAFWVETVIPLANDVLEEHNNFLVPKYGNDKLFLGFDKDELDALQPSRTLVWARVGTAEHITTNEKRLATGYEELPEEEANQVLISSSKVPLTFDETEEESSESLADEQSDPEEDIEDDENNEDDGDKNSPEDIELKVVVRNEKDRRALWKRSNRKRIIHERRFASQLRAAFITQGKIVAKAIEGLTEDQAISAVKNSIEESQEIFEKILTDNMSSILEDFGGAVLRGLKTEVEDYETKNADIKFQSFKREWLSQNVGRRIVFTKETTKRRVVKELRKVFLESQRRGEGIEKLSKRIEKTYKGFAKPRAMLIARTETVSASNAASKAAAKATGIPNLEKEWIPSNDARSRGATPGSTNHISMEGEKVGIDEKFLVPSIDGVDEMDTPGDPEAPVDQIANCRCTMGFVRGKVE